MNKRIIIYLLIIILATSKLSLQIGSFKIEYVSILDILFNK